MKVKIEAMIVEAAYKVVMVKIKEYYATVKSRVENNKRRGNQYRINGTFGHYP